MTTCPAATAMENPASTPDFQELIPSIRRVACYAFRRLPRSRREDLVAEVIANAYAAFIRLIQRGLTALIYPTALAKFAVRQVWSGRRVGTRRNSRDVLSASAQLRHRFVVESLDDRQASGPWQDHLLTDRHATPAELAIFKVDFSVWLAQLSVFKRHVAVRLALGETARDLAARVSVSAARITQIRRELEANWNRYQAVPAES
jgi:hypothetical protein